MTKVSQGALDMLNVDFSNILPVTEETREAAKREVQRGAYLPARLEMGMFPTDEEYEDLRKRFLAAKLP